LARAADLVEIQARGPGDGDDFVTWTAAPSQIRIKAGANLPQDLVVVLTNDAPHPVPPGRTVPLDGDLLFAPSVTAGSTATAATLTLTLPKDGSWVPFVIAGQPGRPSERVKDAVIEAHRDAAAGDLVGSLGVMVRVRKSAASLTAYERDQLLEAIATVKASPSYNTFLQMHLLAVDGSPTNQAHQNAGFLPWHRTFLLHFERELQKTHPHVSLHYWKQELPSAASAGDPASVVAVFSQHFMGVNGAGFNNAVVFASDNDLWGWQINGQLLPRANFNRSNPNYIFNTESLLVLMQTYRVLDNPSSSDSFSYQVESNPHNDGHGWVGGWMASCQTSPQDPIFWLFHCDIDRYWARWQYTQKRYDPTGADPAAYAPNDAYATGSSVPLGHHLNDTLWPWNGLTGPVNPPDPLAERPSTAPNSPFPASPVPGFWPAAPAAPRPADMIDYLGVNKSGIDLGVAYDDTPFGFPAAVAPPSAAIASAVEPMKALANRGIGLDRRLAAAARIQQLPLSPDHVKQLHEHVRATDEPVEIRRAALARLATADPPRALGDALDMVHGKLDAAPVLKAHAADRLGRLGMFTAAGRAQQADVRAGLRELIKPGEPPEVRAEALRWLAAFRDSNTVDLLRDHLAGRGGGLVSMVDALHLLGVAAPGKSGNAVRPHLDDPDPAVRVAALESLGNDADSLPRRRALLADKSQPIEVREAALRSLMHYDDQFPDTALAILADPAESATLRADAAAGVREFARLRADQLGDNGLRGLVARLDQASARAPEPVLQAVARVREKISRFGPAQRRAPQ
jgi:hypothetical protein